MLRLHPACDACIGAACASEDERDSSVAFAASPLVSMLLSGAGNGIVGAHECSIVVAIPDKQRVAAVWPSVPCIGTARALFEEEGGSNGGGAAADAVLRCACGQSAAELVYAGGAGVVRLGDLADAVEKHRVAMLCAAEAPPGRCPARAFCAPMSVRPFTEAVLPFDAACGVIEENIRDEVCRLHEADGAEAPVCPSFVPFRDAYGTVQHFVDVVRAHLPPLARGHTAPCTGSTTPPANTTPITRFFRTIDAAADGLRKGTASGRSTPARGARGCDIGVACAQRANGGACTSESDAEALSGAFTCHHAPCWACLKEIIRANAMAATEMGASGVFCVVCPSPACRARPGTAPVTALLAFARAQGAGKDGEDVEALLRLFVATTERRMIPAEEEEEDEGRAPSPHTSGAKCTTEGAHTPIDAAARACGFCCAEGAAVAGEEAWRVYEMGLATPSVLTALPLPSYDIIAQPAIHAHIVRSNGRPQHQVMRRDWLAHAGLTPDPTAALSCGFQTSMAGLLHQIDARDRDYAVRKETAQQAWTTAVMLHVQTLEGLVARLASDGPDDAAAAGALCRLSAEVAALKARYRFTSTLIHERGAHTRAEEHGRREAARRLEAAAAQEAALSAQAKALEATGMKLQKRREKEDARAARRLQAAEDKARKIVEAAQARADAAQRRAEEAAQHAAAKQQQRAASASAALDAKRAQLAQQEADTRRALEELKEARAKAREESRVERAAMEAERKELRAARRGAAQESRRDQRSSGDAAADGGAQVQARPSRKRRQSASQRREEAHGGGARTPARKRARVERAGDPAGDPVCASGGVTWTAPVAPLVAVPDGGDCGMAMLCSPTLTFGAGHAGDGCVFVFDDAFAAAPGGALDADTAALADALNAIPDYPVVAD